MTPLSDSEAATVARFEAAEPAPESWGGGLGEAIAWAVDRSLDAVGFVDGIDPVEFADALLAQLDLADLAVLALPELAVLRAKADAADRVRKLVAFYDRHEYSSLVVDDLREALDGPQC